jgi:predicted ATPase
MKFHSLKIANLRVIRRFEINDLGSFVVIAGQNGSGKSCVFDAIRLLKSIYGGYSANEYH